MSIKQYILIWILLALITAVCIGGINLPRLYPLARHNVQRTAKVTAVLPNDHDTIQYQFTENGIVFKGQYQTWPPNPDAANLHVWETIVVYFYPDSPSNSIPGDPKLALQNEIISAIIAAIMTPLLLLIGVWRFEKKYSST